MSEKQINLVDYLYILTKWRKLIIINFTVVCIIAIIISLLLPKWYESTAVIMPPKAELKNLDITSLMSKIPLAGLGFPAQNNEVMAFMAILKSRSIKEVVIEEFDLIKVYKKKDIERTLKALEDHADFAIGDEGQILVTVEDKSPQRAANMTNLFVSLLDSIYTGLNIEKARNDRIFIEQRFNQNKEELRAAEEKLRDFQQSYGVIDIPEQTRAAIESAAELQSLVYTTEIELALKQKYLSPTHNEVVQTKAKLVEFKKKLSELKVGNSGSNGNGDFFSNDDLYIPFDQVPELGLRYVRLFRDVEVQNKIFELLIQLYEQAKIEEAKDIPNIQILDYGAVPIYKSRPKRAIIVIVAGLFSIIISCFYVFTKEFMQKTMNRSTEESKKLSWIGDQLRNDIRPLRRKKTS